MDLIIKKTIFLLLFPIFCYAQDIVGTWAKGNNAFEFRSDGTVKLFDLQTGESTLRNLQLKYHLEKDGDINYIVFDYYNHEKLIKQDWDKYKIEDNILYVPKTVETFDGKKTVIEVIDYRDAYEKVKSQP